MSSVTGATSSTNTMRITGMATGLDTDAMVKAMTANIQNKIDKENQDKQIAQWKQDMYRDIIKDVKGLQDYFDPTSSKYILGSNKFNPVNITNSNESIASLSAISTAQAGNYKIDVTQLAKPALLQGSAISAASTTTLESIGVTNGSKLTFNINGKSVTTDAVTSTTTIQNVIDTINNNADIKASGVTASFDDLTKKFVFSTNTSGTTSSLNNVSVSSTTAADIGKLGLSSLTDASGVAASSVNGQNAIFTMSYPDGRQETITNQTSNQFTANGITYNLKSIGSANITVTKNNVDAIVDNLTKFKDDYNNLIDKIQGKLTEKKQFSYKPLTDDQKKDMKDADITSWETKAKQGLLKGDDNLENLLRDLKTSFSDTVFTNFDTSKDIYSQNSADMNLLHVGSFDDNSIGIDTSSDISDLGKIEIKDETKLKDAITNHIEEFTKLFTGKSSAKLDKDPVTGLDKQYVGSEKYYEDGIFTRMDNIIRSYAGDPGVGKDGTSTVKGILNIYANKQYDFSMTGVSSQNTLPDQIYGKVRSITDLTDRLNDEQDRYYKKFSALETAMNNMNSQMNSFKSQMGIS
ncbi:flagellar filament capping protein FliD [Clostridium beijerinckii]|uniref:flagellar filament capping protein FliD n=1 Tax=Clostridium beijerinckii TaxID=1520 RepID=UPI00098BE851|nr:flagellar filament capping protein FliD [Clostridium beijerinckii]MBA8933025.1 flagellar hook-associated protein 2 [Clostridium beijerinckii]NRT79374.1 flagellar hook-associated protein 2 [Clostridium beijerinckii]NRU37228.1 flagellar hook-associated protein 2 [Clostridium beijerinckii]NSA99493.1 flagellar hook-associated protein 2 [Clostridium beijerinckii]OOM49108.1 flagellar capping protein [Clostridium beijerinckii]